MLFSVAWAAFWEADAPVALMADEAASGSGDSASSGGSVTSGDSAGSGEDFEPIQLPAPVRLGWGRDYRFLLELYRKQKPDSVLTDEFGVEYVDCPGMMYWSVEGENQRQYRIDLYRQDPEEGNVLIETVKEWKVTGSGTMDSNFRFFWDARSSGDYYFTVRALGDGVEYVDSEIAQSNVWTYEAPEDRLTRPTRPHWKNVSEASTAFIYPPSDEEAVDNLYRIGYQARWWYAAALTNDTTEKIVQDDDASGGLVTKSGDDIGDTQEDLTKPKEVGTVLTFYPRHYEFKPSDKMIGEYGSGYYSVQVRALSGDINKARPSDWSELSMARYVSAVDEDLTTIVERVDRNTDEFNRQLAINNVRKFGTYKLIELMAADVNNTGAVAAIKQLEDTTGNYAQVVVSGGLNELFPEQTIGVVGAGLNVDLGQTVVFHLGAAHADEVPSTLYSHAVRFSMQLLDTNGASLTPNGTELKVPAKITLPVPDSINPTFFVILHHRMDGTVETLPHVSLRKVTEKVKVTVDAGTSTQSGGETGAQTQTEKTVDKWYASFVITNFSDFTMAEAKAFLEAKAVGGNVSASYRFQTDGVQTALCAVRNPAGRVIAVAKLDPTETKKTVTIPCDGIPDRVKLFLLDAHSAPVCAALDVSVTK